MKNIFQHKIVLLFFIITVQLSAQILPTIEKTNYVVGAGTNVTLTASQSIVIKPESRIELGSTFWAKIDSEAYIPITLSNENYTFTRSFQKAMKDASQIVNNNDVIEKVTYFDGLRRPMQDISIKASPEKQDVITHIGYDNAGRRDREYLPYAATGVNGSYRAGADISADNYYTTNYSTDINSSKPNPYVEKAFDNSPLNRLLQQGAPGKEWALGSGHETKMEYETNEENEVKLFAASTTWNPTLGLYETSLVNAQGTMFYIGGELYKTIIKDENWTSGKEHTTEEFKDKEGHVILKKTYGVSLVDNVAVTTTHETYYVYDLYGHLSFVIPPKADGVISNAILNDLCYQYRYDNRNRMVEKKIPGKGWEYIVYDKLDRAILIQDPNLRAKNKWLFTKYDAYGRPVYTGEYLNTVETSRVSVQGLSTGTIIYENRSVNATPISDANVYYSNVAFPKNGIKILTVNYYDDYKNIDLDEGTSTSSYGVTPETNVNGALTCTKVRVLDSSPIKWITNVNYYDNKSRLIYNYMKNGFLEATNTTKNKLDFSGKILEMTSTHKKGNSTPISVVNVFIYDHMGRTISQKQKINSQVQETIFENKYNNLGQLVSKAVGGTGSGIQKVDYNYNIRGWLKNINDINNIGTDLFAFQINYNDASDPSKNLYNGSVSQTFWKTAHVDKTLRGYSYTYDALNRLTTATDNLGRYNENISYDKNGNILKLFRNGNTVLNTPNYGIIDDLTYNYSGNKLIKVADNSNNSQGFKSGSNNPVQYGYDENGNMETDANKGINTKISYNYLNLPTSLTLPGGTITYHYDATGIKQRKIVGNSITDYANGFQYENDELQFFPHAEGYVRNNSGVYEYIYQYKDHLGNVRLSYNKNLNIIEENNYYPFGLRQQSHTDIIGTEGNKVAQKYKFNGKEFQEELELNMTAMDYRQYDNALGRFNSLDIASEKFSSLSPYSFSANNPILLNDPSGKDWSISATIDENGKLHIKITVNAAIMNISGKKINMQNYIKNQTAQFNRIFSMNRESFDVTAKLNMREVKDADEATKKEHLIQIKHSNNFEEDKGGNSHLGGLNVNINSKFINEDGTTYYNHVLSHEIGHTGGLDHPGEQNSTVKMGINYFLGTNWGAFRVPSYNQNAADLRTNFMSYPEDYIDSSTEKGMQELIKVYQNPGTATRGQISAIMRYYSSNYRLINNNDK